MPTLLAFLAALAFALSARAQTPDSDRWYTLDLLGQRCGTLHTTVESKDGRTTTASVMKFGFSRGEAKGLDISVETTFIETAAGKPVSMTCVKRMATSPVSEAFTFNDDGTVTLVTTQDKKSITKQLPKPEGTWLTPAAADQFLRQRRKAGARDITLRTVDPMEGVDPVSVHYTGFEPVRLTIEGKAYDATKCSITMNTKEVKGVKSVEYIDEGGELLKSQMQLGGFALDMQVSSKEAAMAPGNGGKDGPELMVSTFAKPDRPIANPRHARTTTLLVSVPDGELPAFPTTGAQRVEVVSPTAARLTISAQHPSPAPEADAADAAYLAATTLSNTEDEKIKELAARAVKSAADTPAAKAEACRRFVEKFIKKKNLGVGFATASEVARNATGDCTEHGVLLTALLRANHIPARAVVGMVYADEFAGQEGIFGYHMWTQALLTIDGKPRWVDLDATLSRSTPFDATHIALDTTSLADGSASSGLGALAGVLGRLSIKVEHAE